jgi:hypothetical protein
MTILDNIETTMADLIGGMTEMSGYNYDWGTVNEEDLSNCTFPSAIIDPTDSLADKEKSMDTLAGLGSQEYTNEVLFTVLVVGEMPNFDSNPNFAARSMLRQAMDDLKMLFGRNNQLLGTCDNILYVGSQIETIKRNDVQRPCRLRAIFRVVYSQDRFSPTQYSGS